MEEHIGFLVFVVGLGFVRPDVLLIAWFCSCFVRLGVVGVSVVASVVLLAWLAVIWITLVSNPLEWVFYQPGLVFWCVFWTKRRLREEEAAKPRPGAVLRRGAGARIVRR